MTARLGSLTPRGADFRPVLIAMLAWGNRHFTPDGVSVQIVNAATGEPAEPVMIDRRTGRVLEAPDYVVTTGPAATDGTRARLARPGTLPAPVTENHP